MTTNKVKVNKDFFGDLGTELKNLKADVGNYIAGEASNRLSKTANAAIKSFYDDYTPRNYRRHWQFEDKAFKPYRNSMVKMESTMAVLDLPQNCLMTFMI